MIFRLRTRQRFYLITAAILGLLSLAVVYRFSYWIGGLGLLVTAAVYACSYLECIIFDGNALTRTGPITWLLAQFSGQNWYLPIGEIEMIATESTRLRFPPDRIRYRYRTLVLGSQAEFVLNSSEPGYPQLAKALFCSVGEDKLDPRSSELLYYFDTVEGYESFDFPQDHLSKLPTQLLRSIANGLRLSGQMRQALNCFMVAYQREPNNPHLLYEMARFLRSLAALDGPRLLTRSSACLRLAARISQNEPRLLERIGETYFERLEYDRASRCFARALELDPNLFRAHVGMAEIALRSGKLAHVAHFYSTAAHSTLDAAQARLANREASYYGRLCSDEDYLEAEINRITMLRHLRWIRTAAATVFFIALTAACLVSAFFAPLETLSWSFVISSSFLWAVATLGLQWYNKRLDATV